MSRNRRRTEKMFRNLRKGRYDRAVFQAVDGDPKFMEMYYEGKPSVFGDSRQNQTSFGHHPFENQPPVRNVSINGLELTESAWQIIRQLEKSVGNQLPDGSFWYDPFCGAFGVWGNPTWFFLPPNLPLGGQMHPHCSGPPTGVFINGRDIHPTDLQILTAYVGYIYPGSYYLDAYGNLGAAGMPPSVNVGMLMGR